MSEPSTVSPEIFTFLAPGFTRMRATIGWLVSVSAALTVAVVGCSVALPWVTIVRFGVPMTTCSAYVPAQTTIVVPVRAALTAPWMLVNPGDEQLVSNPCGPGPTNSFGERAYAGDATSIVRTDAARTARTTDARPTARAFFFAPVPSGMVAMTHSSRDQALRTWRPLRTTPPLRVDPVVALPSRVKPLWVQSPTHKSRRIP